MRTQSENQISTKEKRRWNVFLPKMEAIVYRNLHLENSVKIMAKCSLIEKKTDIRFHHLQMSLWE